ncbi:MAG TPA: tetratricopeptide repeat protein, partial [Candidatus Berkiella sp.]|nr:tetratricopeptide repeat protein [Candidatus Berkiella sp.]
DNIYRINIGEDVLEQLGVFYQMKNMDEIALDLYEQSIQTFGDREPSYHNSALIYDKQKNTTKALYNYQKAYGMNKKNKFAYRRIAQLTGKPNFSSFMPIIKLTFVLAVMA